MKDAPDIGDVHAFVDGELDRSHQLAMESAMSKDAALCSRVEQVRDMQAAVRATATYHAAPDALRRRIEAMTLAHDVASAATPSTAPRPQAQRGLRDGVPERWMRWWAWRPLSTAFVATAVLTIGLQIYLAKEGREARLAHEVVASHVRSTLGEHPIDIASSDHHTVKPWLSSKLDFSPAVVDADIGSAVFLGGRVDYMDGRPVAALVYRQGPHLVDAFVWPTKDRDSAVAFIGERGYQIAHWTRAGMNHWVVSDVNRPEFVDLVGRLAARGDSTPPQR